jgi:hypothetical protein
MRFLYGWYWAIRIAIAADPKHINETHAKWVQWIARHNDQAHPAAAEKGH